MFQYKIIRRILPTNSLLHKVKKVAGPFCPFGPSECQTLWHLFINCTHASSFWNRFQQWYSISSNTKLLLSELEVMFGIIRCHNYCLALNHLIILGKYLILLLFFSFTLASRDMSGEDRGLRALHARIGCGRKSRVNSIRHGFSDETNCFRSLVKMASKKV